MTQQICYTVEVRQTRNSGVSSTAASNQQTGGAVMSATVYSTSFFITQKVHAAEVQAVR